MDKATAAKTAIKKGADLKKTHQMRTTPKFRIPRTLRTRREAKYPKHSIQKAGTVNKYKVIEYPLVGESATKLMEDKNTLVFIVNLASGKKDIKRTFAERYDYQIRKINTAVRPDGRKKAYITLTGPQDAVELGSKIGII